MNRKFPSPYGVLFILIRLAKKLRDLHLLMRKFPSPYGVLFILIILVASSKPLHK